jgi:hypothetical protein
MALGSPESRFGVTGVAREGATDSLVVDELPTAAAGPAHDVRAGRSRSSARGVLVAPTPRLSADFALTMLEPFRAESPIRQCHREELT